MLYLWYTFSYHPIVYSIVSGSGCCEGNPGSRGNRWYLVQHTLLLLRSVAALINSYSVSVAPGCREGNLVSRGTPWVHSATHSGATSKILLFLSNILVGHSAAALLYICVIICRES